MVQDLRPPTPMLFDSPSSNLSENTVEASPSGTCPESDQSQNPPSIREICRDLLRALPYTPVENISEKNTIYQTLISEFSPYDTGGMWFADLCGECATIAELCYSHTSEEVRLRVARYNWYLVSIDNLGPRLPDSLESFQESVLANRCPQGAFLQDFRECLADIYRFWDSIPANCIITSALDFVSGCFMEQMPGIRNMKISSSAHSWPYYLRSKTGAPAGYAFLLFPKELQIEMNVYIQVMEDIMLFINLTNDVLSFYKEELAGETNNYVHNRAYVSKKPIPVILQDLVKEILDANKRICEVLKESPVYTAWIQFINGYVCVCWTLEFALGKAMLHGTCTSLRVLCIWS